MILWICIEKISLVVNCQFQLVLLICVGDYEEGDEEEGEEYEDEEGDEEEYEGEEQHDQDTYGNGKGSNQTSSHEKA